MAVVRCGGSSRRDAALCAAIDVAQVEAIHLVVNRFERRVESFVAFVVGGKADAHQLAGRIEQSAAAAAFDRGAARFDVGRALVAIDVGHARGERRRILAVVAADAGHADRRAR